MSPRSSSGWGCRVLTFDRVIDAVRRAEFMAEMIEAPCAVLAADSGCYGVQELGSAPACQILEVVHPLTRMAEMEEEALA